MPIFSPGRPPAGCLMASTEAFNTLRHVALKIMAEQNQAAMRKVCPVDDSRRLRRSAPSSGDASSHSLPRSAACGSAMAPPSPARWTIPGDFRPKCCYPVLTREKRIAIDYHPLSSTCSPRRPDSTHHSRRTPYHPRLAARKRSFGSTASGSFRLPLGKDRAPLGGSVHSEGLRFFSCLSG